MTIKYVDEKHPKESGQSMQWVREGIEWSKKSKQEEDSSFISTTQYYKEIQHLRYQGILMPPYFEDI